MKQFSSAELAQRVVKVNKAIMIELNHALHYLGKVIANYLYVQSDMNKQILPQFRCSIYINICIMHFHNKVGIHVC